MGDQNLFEVDRRKLERYQSIVDFCLQEKALTQLRKVIKGNITTIKMYCTILVESGYLQDLGLKDNPSGMGQKSHFYKTTKKVKLNKAHIDVFKQMVANTLLSKKKAPKKEIDRTKNLEVKSVVAGNVMTVNMDDPEYAKKREATRKYDRSLRKSPKNYISGATLGMAV